MFSLPVKDKRRFRKATKDGAGNVVLSQTPQTSNSDKWQYTFNTKQSEESDLYSCSIVSFSP